MPAPFTSRSLRLVHEVRYAALRAVLPPTPPPPPPPAAAPRPSPPPPFPASIAPATGGSSCCCHRGSSRQDHSVAHLDQLISWKEDSSIPLAHVHAPSGRDHGLSTGAEHSLGPHISYHASVISIDTAPIAMVGPLRPQRIFRRSDRHSTRTHSDSLLHYPRRSFRKGHSFDLFDRRSEIPTPPL